MRTRSHIEVTPEHNGNLFFWHFQNRRIVDRQRTVVWLNGGPGCSSEDGALMEIGPYRVKDDNTLLLNNGSWNEFANLLFVDNPVGTGFSYVDTNSFIHDLDTMANNFVTFLEKFFALFPDYERDDVSFRPDQHWRLIWTNRSSFTLQESPMLDSTSPILPKPLSSGTRAIRRRGGICKVF